MHYGVNCGQPGHDLWEIIRGAVGGFDGWRCYATPQVGVPLSWPGSSYGEPPAGVGFTIASIKPDVPSVIAGSLDEQLRQWVSGARPGDWATLWHEGETNEGWTPNQIKAMHKHAHAVIKAARPDVHYGQISSAYTASPYSAFHPLSQWITRGMDYQGIDGYRASPRATLQTTFEAARQQIIAAAPKAKIAVNEVNSIRDGRAQYLRDVYTWAQTHKCLAYFPFFFSEGDPGAYDWDPTDLSTITEMKRQVSLP